MTLTARDYSADLRKAQTRDTVALSQLISAVEARRVPPGVLREIYCAGGNARVIGVTGPSGSGKSSLVTVLVRELRKRGERVAAVAVDPSSALTGGAILGDRLRMFEHSADPDVFVRSMSARGALGGLSQATSGAVAVLDAAGWDTIIVETVGVGQDEVDIMRIAHTIAVLSVPGLGDDVQAMKAGLLEIADVHVVNKADRKDAGRTVIELRSMLRLARARKPGDWATPVLETVALDGTGVSELANQFGRHRDWLASSGELQQRRLASATEQIRQITSQLLLERLAGSPAGSPMAALARQVARRELDPHSAAQMLISAQDNS